MCYIVLCLSCFRILNYTPDLNKSNVDRAIHNALNVWADATPLTFKKVHKGNADIMISFGSKGAVNVDSDCVNSAKRCWESTVL